MLKNRNLINADDFNVEEINEILNLEKSEGLFIISSAKFNISQKKL